MFSKKVTIFGRQVSAVLLALVAISGLASAGLLTIYGRITATVAAQQAIKLDGTVCNNEYSTCTVSDYITELAPGGEKFCFEHHLKNDASISANVNLNNICAPDCTGITIAYYNSFGTEGPWHSYGDVNATITKEDLSEYIKWTVHINTEGPHYGVGLVLANLEDQQHPFQIWMNNQPQNQVWQTQILHLNEVPCWNAVPVLCPSGVCPNGITATPIGPYDPTNKDFTITVPKSLLGGIGATFKWAMHVETTNQGYYPSTWPNDWCGPISEYEQESTIGTQISNPLTLQSSELKDFYTCYNFAINIKPDTYTITTDIVPV